jgi:hypothetical protein
VTDIPTDSINLNPDDTEADADLSRQARAPQFRQVRRAQISMAFPALLLLGFGALLLANPPTLTAALALGLGLGAIGIGLVARFLFNARRERGLFFLGITLLLTIGFGVAVIARDLAITDVWPVLIIAVGLALLLTFLFERNHERGLILPGVMLIVAGVSALAFTLRLLPTEVLTIMATNWPLVFVVIAVLLLPRVFGRRRTG